MINHALIKNIELSTLVLPDEYENWLKRWLQNQNDDIESGDVASSLCLQAIIAEIVLYGQLQHDWQGIFSSYLTVDGDKPLAYSEKYGKRLYKFDEQWKQTTVHAIYTRYWFEKLQGDTIDLANYVDLIEGFIQPNGWIYNPTVSPTQLRTRIRSELFMSMAMGIEILAAGTILDQYEDTLKATIADTSITGYISAEYFRLLALEILDSQNLFPTGLSETIKDCKVDLGYCDFSLKNKVDDYMGTAKRTSRDTALYSPLTTAQTLYLSNRLSIEDRDEVILTVRNLARHLQDNPLDIPAFRIRDLDAQFGTDISPIEIVCASWLMQQYSKVA